MNRLEPDRRGIELIGYGHDLQFGVFVTPAAESADHAVALSALAEEVGYDLVT